jgi:hypothetical protein
LGNEPPILDERMIAKPRFETREFWKSALT